MSDVDAAVKKLADSMSAALLAIATGGPVEDLVVELEGLEEVLQDAITALDDHDGPDYVGWAVTLPTIPDSPPDTPTE